MTYSHIFFSSHEKKVNGIETMKNSVIRRITYHTEEKKTDNFLSVEELKNVLRKSSERVRVCLNLFSDL